MTQQQAIDKILSYIEKSEKLNLHNDFNSNNDKTHIIEVENHYVSVRELKWTEVLQIENESLRKNKNNIYLSSEYQKREILKKALLSILDNNNEKIDCDFSDLKHEFIEKLWSEYYKYLHLSAQEAESIYNNTKKYFDPDNNEFKIINPLIIQVDYMTKGILHFSFEEFNNLTIKDFETIQLILACKNEITS